MQNGKLAILISAALLFASGASADPGLLGHEVSFQVLTYDDPAKPEFQGAVHRARVGDKVEFGLGYEGTQNELDVVPILVDIGEDRIEVSYANSEPGTLWKARFNGYQLTFEAGCTLIRRAYVDPNFTNMQFDNKHVRIDGNVLRLNVSEQTYDRDSRIGIDLDVADCPSS